MDYELFNQFLNVGIGAFIFIMLACFTYILSNIIRFMYFCDKADKKEKKDIVFTALREYENKKNIK